MSLNLGYEGDDDNMSISPPPERVQSPPLVTQHQPNVPDIPSPPSTPRETTPAEVYHHPQIKATELDEFFILWQHMLVTRSACITLCLQSLKANFKTQYVRNWIWILLHLDWYQLFSVRQMQLLRKLQRPTMNLNLPGRVGQKKERMGRWISLSWWPSYDHPKNIRRCQVKRAAGVI